MRLQSILIALSTLLRIGVAAYDDVRPQPVRDSSRDRHEEIGPVLIYGECADDNDMLTTLRQVLTEQLPNGHSGDLSRVRNVSPDPAFAGSRSMARAMWEAHGSEYERHCVMEL